MNAADRTRYLGRARDARLLLVLANLAVGAMIGAVAMHGVVDSGTKLAPGGHPWSWTVEGK